MARCPYPAVISLLLTAHRWHSSVSPQPSDRDRDRHRNDIAFVVSTDEIYTSDAGPNKSDRMRSAVARHDAGDEYRSGRVPPR